MPNDLSRGRRPAATKPILSAPLYAAAIIALSLAPSPAHAQGNVAGSWTVEYPRRVMNDGSGDRVTETGKATMTLQLKGDSVIGQWTTNDAGRPPAARHLHGIVKDGTVTLTAEPTEAVIRGPEGESRVKLVGTYTFTVNGDSLEGTQQMIPQDDALPAGPRMPFKGTRQKG